MTRARRAADAPPERLRPGTALAPVDPPTTPPEDHPTPAEVDLRDLLPALEPERRLDDWAARS